MAQPDSDLNIVGHWGNQYRLVPRANAAKGMI
jgi:hypothetical protein